jgi:hypothetical protein
VNPEDYRDEWELTWGNLPQEPDDLGGHRSEYEREDYKAELERQERWEEQR